MTAPVVTADRDAERIAQGPATMIPSDHPRPPATASPSASLPVGAPGGRGWFGPARLGTREPRARTSPPGPHQVPGSWSVLLGHIDPLVTDGIAGTANVLSARRSPRREIPSGS